MRNTLSKFLIFTAGTAIGSVVTWKIVRDKYESTIQAEIQAIRELYANDNIKSSSEEDRTEESDEEEQEEYKNVIDKCGYVQYSDKKEEQKEGYNDMNRGIYVIDQDDWDDNDYDKESVYCFADGVIANEMEEEIENADELVGPDAAQWLDESGNDWVYIRNDRLETDYEVLRDIRRYSEVE